MLRLRRTSVSVLVLATTAACSDGKNPASPPVRGIAPEGPSRTLSSGSTSTLLGRSTFADAKGDLKVMRITDDWHFDLKAKPGFDLAVQDIVFKPGGQSGWHSHPGPVFIQILSGTMTFYMSDDPTCTPIVRTKGQSYLDFGDHAHIARNETADAAENLVTYFVPPGAALRNDEPRPGNCPF